MRRPLALSCLIGLLAAACGPSQADVKRAHEARYTAPYDVVWDAVMAEMHKRYDKLIAAEDKPAGVTISAWRKIETSIETQDTNNMSGAAALAAGGGDRLQSEGREATATRNYVLLRTKVRVKPLGEQGPPWTVECDAEAAQYHPDLSRLVPWQHGDENEPIAVRTTAENLSVAIYERLKKYAH